MPKILPSSAAFRLGVAFVAILVLFAASLLVTLVTFEQLAAAERNVAALDDSKHAGHVVAGLVREQYIHQAHSIIEGDRSHLEHYEVAAQHAHEAAGRLRSAALSAGERTQAEEIARLSVLIDREFHARILPLVDAGDSESVRALHADTERLVERVVAVNEGLNRELERRAVAAREREGVLRARAATIVLSCFALAIAVTAGAWAFVGQSVLRRLSELRKGALQLAGGELGARVPVRGSDELAELATTFNEMSASLEGHQKKLVLSQRLALLGQVAAGVAHEINNPLGVILGYLKLLRRDARHPEEVAEQLRIVEDEAHQCRRVIQGLLELGRPGSAQRAPVNLADTARDALERLQETGRVGKRTVESVAPDPLAVVCGDASGLRQVVSNLLANAVEATTESGRIAVRVRRDGNTLELEVEDDGPGIPPEHLGRVFDPFYTTKPSGTGLGLAISQAIALTHGGALELRSSPGAGTCACLRLPAAPPAKNRGT